MKKSMIGQNYSKVSLMKVLKVLIFICHQPSITLKDDFERFWKKKHYFVIFSHKNIETITTIDCDKKELPRSMEQNKSVRWRM